MQVSPPYLPSLLTAFKGGSEPAFCRIFEVYDERLMKYASAICLTSEDAEEVVQDVFIALWNHRKKIEGDDITGWLLKVCRNLSIKSLRNRIIKTDITVLPELASGAMDPEQKLHFEELERCTKEIIQTLPGERKKIFLMSREENMSYRDIAIQLGISEMTVKKQVSLALKDVRSKLTPHLEILTLLLLSQY